MPTIFIPQSRCFIGKKQIKVIGGNWRRKEVEATQYNSCIGKNDTYNTYIYPGISKGLEISILLLLLLLAAVIIRGFFLD